MSHLYIHGRIGFICNVMVLNVPDYFACTLTCYAVIVLIEIARILTLELLYIMQ